MSSSRTPDRSPTLVALLDGPDQPGLVARTANWIFQRNGNILHADQHRDDEQGIFFQRFEWHPAADDDPAESASEFASYATSLGMRVTIRNAAHRPKVALFVSKIPHCFVDFLARWQMDEFHCEVALVISNHPDMQPTARHYGVPFHHIPVNKDAKCTAEDQQLALLQQNGIELVVMARYMQILSERFLDRCNCPVINIHHSFLPAFAGAKPYHQAYARGVKLIGATAHYATPVLDDGPIIQQDVSPVNHRHSVNDLVRRGRDLEKSVLAQAVRWHLQHRVLVYLNKTVVFD